MHILPELSNTLFAYLTPFFSSKKLPKTNLSCEGGISSAMTTPVHLQGTPSSLDPIRRKLLLKALSSEFHNLHDPRTCLDSTRQHHSPRTSYKRPWLEGSS